MTCKIPHNMVILSGMHGTGKNTLMEDFFNTFAASKHEYELICYHKCKMTSFDNIFERQTRRIAKYAIDWYRLVKMAIENPSKLVITDRCYWDAYAYLLAFKNINWLSGEEFDWLLEMLNTAFMPYDKDEIKPFILMPSYEMVQSNLAQRQQKYVKWNEKDEEYNRAVYDAYKYMFQDRQWLEMQSNQLCTVEDRNERVKQLQAYANDMWQKHLADALALSYEVPVYHYSLK